MNPNKYNISINLLWTGGLDSTFRLVELSKEEVDIQPYYIIDPSRRSTPQEMKAMDDIYGLLKSKPQTKATLKDIIFIELDSIEPNIEINKSWEQLFYSHKLGCQYDFLARFAHQKNIILEVGIENSHRSKAATVLKEYGNLQLESYFDNDGIWSMTYRISESCRSKECKEIFKRLRFPKHLFHLEKLEEIQLLKEWGDEDILLKTWFCHNPVLGYPCGRCNPCKDALNEGLSWRVPLAGRIMGTVRYYINGSINKLANVFKS